MVAHNVSIDTPSMNGMGQTPSFMVEGTWVVGFFRDAMEKQQPVIIGTFMAAVILRQLQTKN